MLDFDWIRKKHHAEANFLTFFLRYFILLVTENCENAGKVEQGINN